MWPVRSEFPSQRLNPCLLQWKHGVLTPGPPGKSINMTFTCTGKLKGFSDSLHCDINISFIAMAWN